MIMKKSVFSLIIFSILWLLTSCKPLEQQELKSKSSQAPASMTLPKLDNTMMASMTAGSAGDIDPTTNLTTTETALLSPLEQAYYTNKRRA